MKNTTSKDDKLAELHSSFEKILQENERKRKRDFDDLSNESKNLYIEYNKLQSFTDKLKFWKENFWVKKPCNIDIYEELNGLISIQPEKEEEVSLFNIERIAIVIQNFQNFTNQKYKSLQNGNINFEELTDKYQVDIKSIVDKQKFTEKEITEIYKLVEKKDRYFYSSYRKPNLFGQSFKLFYDRDIEFHLGERIYKELELREIITGINAAKYMKFLDTELEELNPGIKIINAKADNKIISCNTPFEKSILTRGQLAILIDYLRKFKIITQKDNAPLARLFEKLTGISESSIRYDLTYITSEKTEYTESKRFKGEKNNEPFGNLKKVRDILSEIVKIIENEIR